MRELEPTVVDCWPSEDNVVFVHLIILVDVLCAREPHEVNHTSSVAEMCHHTLLAWRHLKLLERQYLAPYLHEGHVARQLVNGIDAAPVHIFIWIVLQKVAPCVDIQFLVEDILAVGAYTGQIHYVLREYVHDESLVLFDECFGYNEVERCGELNVLAVAVDHSNFVS